MEHNVLTNANLIPILNNGYFNISTVTTPPFSLLEIMHLLILGCLLTPSIRLVHGKGLGATAKPVVLLVTFTFAYL